METSLLSAGFRADQLGEVHLSTAEAPESVVGSQFAGVLIIGEQHGGKAWKYAQLPFRPPSEWNLNKN